MLLVLRNLSVYQYGVIELVQSILPIMSIFLLPGLSTLIITDMGIEKEKGNLSKMKGIFFAYVKVSIFLGVLAWLVLFLGANLIATFYSDGVGSYYQIISLSLLISSVRSILLVYFSVMFKFRELSLLGIFEECVKLIAIFFYVSFSGLGIVTMLWAIVLSQGFAVVFLIPRFIRLYRRHLREVVAEAVTPASLFYAHGKWGLAINYLSNFGGSMRLWLIKAFVGTEAVGLFAVATGLLGHTRALIPLGNIISPIIPQYVADRPRFYRIVKRSIKYQVIGYSAIGIGALVVFPYVLSMLFPEYVTAFPLFQILLITLVPTAFASVFNQMFFALQEQKSLFYSLIVRTALSLALLPVLTSLFGQAGMAYEFVLVTVLFTFERYRVLQKILPDFRITMKSLFFFDNDDKLLIEKIRRKITYMLA
jgi:O-antigen/teichoic acid export membrane protein